MPDYTTFVGGFTCIRAAVTIPGSACEMWSGGLSNNQEFKFVSSSEIEGEIGSCPVCVSSLLKEACQY